jgi:sec-independent protein translocase protein TatB
MFDLGWDEMALIAVVALVVLGPKELPNALRTVSGLMKQARKLAGEFQSGMNEIIREAELEEAKKAVQDFSTKGAIASAIEKTVDPAGELKSAFQKPEDDDKSVTTQVGTTAGTISAGTVPAGAVEAEVNPAVAAFGPNGSAHIRPDVEEEGESPIAATALRETPIETISHTPAAAPSHEPASPAASADAELAAPTPPSPTPADLEKSKTS